VEILDISIYQLSLNLNEKIVSKNYHPIGAYIFIDDIIAPDGEYYYLKDNRKLTIKAGKI